MVLYFITLLQLLSWAVLMMRVILPAINRCSITVQNAVRTVGEIPDHDGSSAGSPDSSSAVGFSQY